MGPKKLKIKIEDKSAAYSYLKKAEDNHAAMISALKNNNYNAVGTLAVQCAISSADAICVYKKGERSASQDHIQVCKLIESIPLPEAKEKSSILRRIIIKKNVIQYECRNIHSPEAHELAKSAKRIFEWAAANINRE